MTSDFEKFLVELINKELQKVEVAFIAKIILFDKVQMLATIRPQLKAVTEETGIKLDSDTIDIHDVPCEFIFAGGAYIRPEYTKNDLVKVSCYASSIQQPIESGKRTDILFNRFQLNYCTVTAGIKPDKFVPPTSFEAESGLIVGKGTKFIVFEATKIRVEGDFDIQGDLSVSGKIDAGGEITTGPSGTRVMLSTHVHPGIGSPPTPVP